MKRSEVKIDLKDRIEEGNTILNQLNLKLQEEKVEDYTRYKRLFIHKDILDLYQLLNERGLKWDDLIKEIFKIKKVHKQNRIQFPN